MAPELDHGELERLISTAEALPPCPPVLNKVAEICRDPSSNARDLGNVIATDEALTSRLIKMVNSAYYGLRGTISTVTQAVVVLGYQEIKNMVYAVRAEDVFRGGEVVGGIDLMALWDHSLQVAVLAREMSYRKRYPIPEEVFVAGIIHDIGQVVLNQVLGADYRKFRDRSHSDGLDLVASESRQFGTTHAEIGRRLAEKWNFPELLQSAVAHHHSLPAGEAFSGIAPFVLAANRVTVARERGASAGEALSDIGPDLLDYLKLDLTRLDEELGRAAQEYNRIRGTFDLGSPEEAT